MTITYEELLERHFALSPEVPTIQEMATREKKKRIIRIFMESRRRQPSDAVGSEFSEEERARYIDEAGASSRHTRNTLRSCLSQLARTLELLEEERNVPALLQDRLAHLISKSGVSVAALAREMAIPESLLRWWTRKGLVFAAPRAMEMFAALERRFGATPGYLTSLVVEKPVKQARPRTPFGLHMAEATHLVYRLAHWPPELELEFKLLAKFKTTAIPGVEQYQNPKRTWRAEGMHARERMVHSFFESFFGFLVLPRDAPDPRLRGMGYSLEELTMALVAIRDLLYAYFEFMKARRGFVTATCLLFCEIAAMLLDPRWGFLIAFGEKFRGNYTAAEWAERCAQARTFCTTFQKINENVARRGRDPFAPLLHFLADDKPMAALWDLRDSLKAKLHTGRNPVSLAVRFRDYLAYELLLFHPVRVANLSMMKWGDNLLQAPNGGWILRFSPGELKNERAGGNEGYNEVVDESLWSDIEEYRNDHRLHLAGAESPFVLLPSLHELPAFSTVIAVDEGEHTVTIENKKGIQTLDISQARCDGTIRIGDTIRVKRRFDMTTKKAITNEKGLDVGEIVMHAHEEKNVLWALAPRALSERLRDLTAAIPGPDGGPGAGFAAQAFRPITATDYIVTNPGDWEGAADLLKDKVDTVRESYAWIEKRILQKRRAKQRKEYLADRARAEKRDEGGGFVPGKPPRGPKGGSPPASPTRGRPVTPQKPRGG